MTERARGRRGRVDGERLVAAFEASELGRKAFCEAHSVSVNTLDYWRKRVRPRGDGRASGFVELKPSADGGRLDVELDLGGGTVLRIRRSG
ncbi:MAG: hypothetical protein P8Y95_04350 [Gammaproteobacteria bacterium]|jgi:hypothetical protein